MLVEIWLGPKRLFCVTKTTPEPGRRIASYWLDIPGSLFGFLEDLVGDLTPSHQKVAMVLELVRVEEHVACDRGGAGRPRHCRRAMARALLAKATLGIPTTEDLRERLACDSRLRRICGFSGRVPSAATFSRAFSDLASQRILDEVHEASVRFHLGQEIVHHASIDSTAIKVRESPPKKHKSPWTQRRKTMPKQVGKTRQERQVDQSPQESFLELPMQADWGMKIGSQHYREKWPGYKFHANVGDGGFPLAAYTTSASLHDSQAAIPLMKMASQRVRILYHLMDKAYQGEPIRTVAERLGQVVIVPPRHVNKTKPAPQLEPHRWQRFRNRTAAERFFSDLKENHGGRHLYVRGAQKVHAHLMCGVLCIFALALLRS